MKTKHGMRRMGNKGRPNSTKNNRKGEVGNNNKGVMRSCYRMFPCGRGDVQNSQ